MFIRDTLGKPYLFLHEKEDSFRQMRVVVLPIRDSYEICDIPTDICKLDRMFCTQNLHLTLSLGTVD
jgi:hypothetical protein